MKLFLLIVFYMTIFFSKGNNVIEHLKLGDADLALKTQLKKGIKNEKDSLIISLAYLYTYQYNRAYEYLKEVNTNYISSTHLHDNRYYQIPFCSDLDYNKGILYLELNKTTKATYHFCAFKNRLSSEEDIAIIDEFIEDCWVKHNLAKTNNDDFITPLSVNTRFNEHSPVFDKEGNFLYTSDRFMNSKIRYDEILFHDNEQKETSLFDFLKNTGRTPLCISDDGKILFIFEKEHKNDGHIYWSTKNESQWSIPERLPAPINSDHTETSAYFLQETNTLYFSSNRPGGYGGLDLYTSTWVDENWSEPINLGNKVNTPYDEEAPFYEQKSNLLYFSSNKKNTIGGYDIFSINLLDTASVAYNLGLPINSPNEDIFFSRINDDSFVFASNRKESVGKMDLFKIDLTKITDTLYKWHMNKEPDDLKTSVNIEQCFFYEIEHSYNSLEKQTNYFWLIDKKDTVYNKKVTVCLQDDYKHYLDLYTYDKNLNFYNKEAQYTLQRDSISFHLSKQNETWSIQADKPLDYQVKNTYWYTNNGLITNNNLPEINEQGETNTIHHVLSEIQVKENLFYIKINAL